MIWKAIGAIVMKEATYKFIEVLGNAVEKYWEDLTKTDEESNKSKDIQIRDLKARVHELEELVTKPKVPQQLEPPTGYEVVKRKPRDTTVLNQYMYHFILDKHKEWKNNGGVVDCTVLHSKAELFEYLNEILGLDKGRTFYSNIINGRRNYNKLPVGSPVKVNME